MLPLDILLDERNVFSPDVLWYAEGRDDRLSSALLPGFGLAVAELFPRD